MVAGLSNERGRRRRGRAERGPPSAQRFGALPPIDNPLPAIEVLDAETLTPVAGEETGLRLRTIGWSIHHPTSWI